MCFLLGICSPWCVCVLQKMLLHLKEKKDVGFFASLSGLMQQCRWVCLHRRLSLKIHWQFGESGEIQLGRQMKKALYINKKIPHLSNSRVLLEQWLVLQANWQVFRCDVLTGRLLDWPNWQRFLLLWIDLICRLIWLVSHWYICLLGWSLIHSFIECRCNVLDLDPTDWQITILIDSICWLISLVDPWFIYSLTVAAVFLTWTPLTDRLLYWLIPFAGWLHWLILDSFIHWMLLQCFWPGPHWLTDYDTDWFALLVDFIGWSLIHLFIECHCSVLDLDPTDRFLYWLIQFAGWLADPWFICSLNEAACSVLDLDPIDWHIPTLIDLICWLTGCSLIHSCIECGCSVLDLDAFERTKKAEGLGMASEAGSGAGEKNMHDAEFTCKLFRFLQLLCEGHNSGERLNLI